MEEENNEIIKLEEKSKEERINEYSQQIQELINEKNELEYNTRTSLLIYINKIRYLQQQIDELLNN